jgi:hypothetical protein
MYSSDRRVGRLKKYSLRWRSQDLKLIWDLQIWPVLANWVNFQRLGYFPSTPPTYQVGEFLTLDHQIRVVIFLGIQRLWFWKTCCMS